MALRFTTEVSAADRDGLVNLYGDEAYYRLFHDSFAKCLAYDGSTLVGAVRVISEGVETALLVDLAVSDSQREDAAQALLGEIEKNLYDRRVMAFGRREYLDIFEKAGYGRCKNAWTLFRNGMQESDFLSPGYRFEGETEMRAPAGNGIVANRGNEPKAVQTAAQKTVSQAEQVANTGTEVDCGRVPQTVRTAVQDALRSEGTKVVRGAIRFLSGLGEASFTEVNEVLTRAFFGRPHDVEKTTKAFVNSQYMASAYDGGQLVGVARAVSDGERYATILNVAVDPEYQGLSVGKNLLRRLENDIREEVVVLNTHPGAVGFYNRLPELRRNKYVFEKHVTAPASGGRHEGNPEFRNRMFTPVGYRFPDEQEGDAT